MVERTSTAADHFAWTEMELRNGRFVTLYWFTWAFCVCVCFDLLVVSLSDATFIVRCIVVSWPHGETESIRFQITTIFMWRVGRRKVVQARWRMLEHFIYHAYWTRNKKYNVIGWCTIFCNMNATGALRHVGWYTDKNETPINSPTRLCSVLTQYSIFVFNDFVLFLFNQNLSLEAFGSIQFIISINTGPEEMDGTKSGNIYIFFRNT